MTTKSPLSSSRNYMKDKTPRAQAVPVSAERSPFKVHKLVSSKPSSSPLSSKRPSVSIMTSKVAQKLLKPSF